MARNYIEYYLSNKQQPASSLELAYAGHEVCKPGHFFGPAVRVHYLIHFILKGKGFFTARGSRYSLHEGQLFLIKPGEECYYIADEKDPWEYMWIGFSGSEVTLILQDCGLMGNRPILDFENAPLLTDTLAHLIQQCEHKEENRYTLLGNLYLIFGCLTETHRESYTTVKNIYLRQALNYIQNNYTHHISVQSMCSFLGIDRTYLYRLFMKELGISPKNYILSYQLKVAGQLVTNSDLPIREIASACGFSSSASFAQQFYRTYGRSPRKFRNIDDSAQTTWSQTEACHQPVQDPNL